MIKHCLDLMPIEINFFNNIFNIVVRVKMGTKDHIGARREQQDLGIRSALHPVGNEIPMASYTLDDRRTYALLEQLKTLKFLDGYVSDPAGNIYMTKHSIFGIKSQDCYVFMQCLIPISLLDLLPVPVWEPLIELSLFFKMLM